MLAYTVIIKSIKDIYRYETFYGSNDRTEAWRNAIDKFGSNVMFIVPGLNQPYFEALKQDCNVNIL
jgi:hypothetical protein